MVEQRDIEIFLTLAEELHFGRTVERLHVSTARASPASAGFAPPHGCGMLGGSRGAATDQVRYARRPLCR